MIWSRGEGCWFLRGTHVSRRRKESTFILLVLRANAMEGSLRFQPGSSSLAACCQCPPLSPPQKCVFVSVSSEQRHLLRQPRLPNSPLPAAACEASIFGRLAEPMTFSGDFIRARPFGHKTVEPPERPVAPWRLSVLSSEPLSGASLCSRAQRWRRRSSGNSTQ